MSRTALVVAGILVLTLGAIFFILQSTPTRPTSTPIQANEPTSPLPDVAPRNITNIEIAPTEGTAATLTRQPDNTWRLARADTGWPIDPRAIDPIFRLLSPESVDALTNTDQPRQKGPHQIFLTLDHPRGPTTIKLSTQPLAGRIAVESSNGFTGAAPAELLDHLTNPGPRAWRLTNPFPAFSPPTATRLRIDATERTILLARLDNRWRVLQPLAARANPLVIDDALARLEGYRIESFLDDPPATSDTGLDPPAISLTISKAKPGADADTRILRIGDAFPGGASRYATVNTPAPITVVLSGPPPTSFSTAVRSYLATTATGVSPSDVGAIRLRWKDDRPERLIERSLDAWIDKPANLPADADAVSEALAFLATEPAEPQESFSESDIRILLRIELLDFAGGPLDVLALGYNADAVLTVRGQNVVWLYGRYRGPSLFNLPAFNDLSPQGDPPPPPDREGDYPSK